MRRAEIRDNALVVALEYPTQQETSPSLVAVLATVDLAVDSFRGQSSPDGTVTVVFTDIEQSTALLERLGEERWLEVIREHNRIVRKRASAREGVVVSSQGDGFLLVFASARAALACAVELQRTFAAYTPRGAEEHLRVRIGMHTGNVFQERDDFLGRDVIMAARITGCARGGEIVVSEAVKRYTERGGRWRFGPALEVRLKGLAADQRVHPVYWRSELD